MYNDVFVCVLMYVYVYMISAFSVARQLASPMEWCMHHSGVNLSGVQLKGVYPDILPLS